MSNHKIIKPGEWGGIPRGATLLCWWYTRDGTTVSYYARLNTATLVRGFTDNYHVLITGLTPDDRDGRWARVHGHTSFNSKPCDWLFASVVSKDGNPGLTARREQRETRRWG